MSKDAQALALEKGKKEHAVVYQQLVDSKIRLCELTSRRLILVLEDPRAVDIFSAEKIININQSQRQIPGIIEKMRELKLQISAENYGFIASGGAKRKIKELDDKSEKIQSLADSVTAEIPEYKPGIFGWIVLPYSSAADCINKIMHKIRMKNLEREKKKLKDKKLN